MSLEHVENYLRSIWKKLVQSFPIPIETKDLMLEKILECYNEPHRRYHTLAHITAMNKHCDQLENMLDDVEALRFAIFYHDIVYDSHREDNEEKSALMAIEALTELGLDEFQIAKIAEMIRRTAKHDGEDSPADTQYFLDIDLSILGTIHYASYKEGVEFEYSWVPEEMYRNGRKKVLEHCLMRPRIYFTDYFHDRLETKARENIQQELAKL